MDKVLGFVRYHSVLSDRDGYLPTVGGVVVQLVPYSTPEAATEAARLLAEKQQRAIWKKPA